MKEYMSKEDNILEINNLSKEFALEAGFFSRNKNTVYAVNDVSFSVQRGSTYGLLGESGCGKTTTARLCIGLYGKTSGSVLFYPEKDSEPLDVHSLKGKAKRVYREQVKYIFQDPAKSLNPRLTVLDVLTSALRFSSKWQGKKEAFELASKIISEVGLTQDDLFRRPAEFSGGQRQRISIARALVMSPKLLICDEVVSALDVSIQGQVINLLTSLKKERNLSYIFITHDLRVASYFCDRIGVMYRGVLVEEGDAKTLYKDSLHPYTKLLFEGTRISSNESNLEVKTVLQKENACPFFHRCKERKEICGQSLPDFYQAGDNHRVRCFLCK